MPDTKSPPTSKDVPEPTTEEQVEEVPWDDKDVDLLSIALQRVAPFFLGNDVRSPESARKVAILLLEAFLDMGYDQPKPGAEFKEYAKVQASSYMDTLRQEPSGNSRTQPAPSTPTPTEQVANQSRKNDPTDDEGKSAEERRAENLKNA